MLSDPELSQLRIFPLPNVVLFPAVRLPLHIFEPRYREMTRDALASNGVIAMVLLQADPASDPREQPPVYAVGCAGRIVEHEELPDGRFNLILEGHTRVRIRQELQTGEAFRRVRAEPWPELPDHGREPAFLRELDQLRRGLEETVLELTRRDAPSSEARFQSRLSQLDTHELVNSIAFGLDCPAIEKQALLEAPELLDRAQMLERLLAFRLAEARLPQRPANLH